MGDSERWFLAAFGIWLLGVFAYFVPAATWNPVSRFDLTRSIVEQHTLSIDSYAENTGDRAYARGHWYTDKAPVPSALAVPAYALYYAGQLARGERPEYSVSSTSNVPAVRVSVNGSFQRGLYVCSLSTAGVGTALLGVLLFHLLARRFSAMTALVGSAGTVLGTPLLPYATSFYGHGVAAFFLVAAFAALFADPDRTAKSAFVKFSGASFALACGSEYLATIPALVFAAAWLSSLPRGAMLRGTADLVLGAAVPAFLVAAYHAVCFGAPFRTGYSFLVRPEFITGHASGFMGLHLPTVSGLNGLLFGTSRGLFFLSPVTALALGFAVVHAIRIGDPAARAAVLGFASLLLVNGGYYMWWGGAASGPRHLVPGIGFLAFGLAGALESRARWLTAILLLASVSNLLVLTAVGLEAPDHGNALFDYAYRRLLRGDVAALSGASNIGIRMGLARGASLGPLLVWLVLGARFLARRVGTWVPPRPGAPPGFKAMEPSTVPLSPGTGT